MFKHLFYAHFVLFSSSFVFAGGTTSHPEEKKQSKSQAFYLIDDNKIEKTLYFFKEIEKKSKTPLSLELKKTILDDHNISADDLFEYIEKKENSFKGRFFRFKNGFGLKKAEKISELPAFEKIYHTVHIFQAMQKAQSGSIKDEIQERILTFYDISLEDILLYLDTKDTFFSKNCFTNFWHDHSRKIFFSGLLATCYAFFQLETTTQDQLQSTASDILYCPKQSDASNALSELAQEISPIPNSFISFLPTIFYQNSIADYTHIFFKNTMKWASKSWKKLFSKPSL